MSKIQRQLAAEGRAAREAKRPASPEPTVAGVDIEHLVAGVDIEHLVDHLGGVSIPCIHGKDRAYCPWCNLPWPAPGKTDGDGDPL